MDVPSYRVLVIDDESRQFQLIEATLLTARLAKFDVFWSPTYESGLSHLADGNYDICLIDYHLGKRSGVELMKEARRTMEDAPPFVLITGEGNAEVDQEALEAGAVDYLDKGNLTPELLERTIRYTIRGARDARALRISEARNRHLLATVPAGVFIYQNDRLVYVNEMFCVLTLYTKEELIGNDLLDLIDPGYHNIVTHWIQSGYQPSQSEIPFITRTGEVRWFGLTMSITDYNNQPATLGAIINVTRRKQIEQALWESEKRFRALVEYGSDRITQISAAGTIVYTSPSTRRILGYSEFECVNKSYYHFVHEEDRNRLRARITEMMERNQETITEQYRVKHKTQGYIWMEGIASNLLDDAPIHSIVINARDITENKQAIAAEKEQRVRAEALVDTAAALNSTLELDEVLDRILANVGKVIPHDEANIMLIEGGFTRIVGYRNTKNPGKQRDWDAVPRFPVDETYTFRTMLETGEPLIVPDVQHAKHWQEPEVQSLIRSYMGVPIRVNDAIIGFINLDAHEPDFFQEEHLKKLMDFSHQSAIAIQNARAYAQAQQLAAAEERQRLARDLHDAVSQTLFSASMMAETLPRLMDTDTEQVKDGLLRLARMTRGALAEMRTLLLELRPQAVVDTELGILLDHLVNSMRGRSDANYTLNVSGERQILPPELQVAVYRIAQESLNNIFKHAAATSVTVTLDYEPDNVRLEVVDNGAGFDPDAIPPDHHGLQIMYERAASVDADLSINSQPDRGTTVKFVWSFEGIKHDN